jgi:hypothetical protein
MTEPTTTSAITKQMEAVERQLDGPRCTGEKRLALLRRQAQLGDLRDAFALRERRRRAAAAQRPAG